MQTLFPVLIAKQRWKKEPRISVLGCWHQPLFLEGVNQCPPLQPPGFAQGDDNLECFPGSFCTPQAPCSPFLYQPVSTS